MIERPWTLTARGGRVLLMAIAIALAGVSLVGGSAQASCGSIKDADQRNHCYGSCGSIRDADKRNYCYATKKGQSSCGSIRDADLRNRCYAERDK